MPEQNTAIKGRARSRSELLAVSGYAERPEEFDDLLQVLSQELRLLAPTQQEGGAVRTEEANRGEPYFQLTHDYLVP
ncbi:hypothetical protein, partial [Salmonella enterica]|uniref:hypothetical protein n=1 Tax=Salmonella enterica TaxID=28901 RepID=UPI003CF6C3C7